MSTFEQRLTVAIERFKSLQSGDGGWSERLQSGYNSSIVNTVEVLAVMRAGGVSYRDDAVENAVKYLTKAVVEHPSVGGAGRGPYTRYCAWGLSGLTLYRESRHDKRLLKAQEHCVLFLKEHQLRDGGWGESPPDCHPSIISTSAAIAGLARVCPYAKFGDDAQSLLRDARKIVGTLRHETGGTKPKTYWSLDVREVRDSWAATAMAVISLAGGSPHDRKLAAQGAEWLRDNVRKWQTEVETGGGIHPSWRHMSFSLALRAVVRAGREPSVGEIKRVVGYLDALWIDDVGLWARGRPDADSSTSGAYAVVAAYEAYANARRFDPDREILRHKADKDAKFTKARGHLYIGFPETTLESEN